MSDGDLRQLIERLAARLDRIEKRLDMEPGRKARAAPTPPARRTAAPVPPTAPPTGPPIAPPARPRPPVRVPASPRKPRAPLELRIGQNWSAWVGAIVIVLGAYFTVKLGWVKMSPELRLLAVAGFGALLVGAGEIALRRVGVAASVGLFGAGLGTLYLDGYAAFEWFTPAVVTREWSFVLMAAVAVLGFGITLRSGFASIGIISIVGGYLTPWLLGAPGAYTIETGSFLTMLLGVSLALSMVRPRSFRVLRYVAVGGTAVTGLVWLDGALGSNWMAALLLPTMWWAMVLAESVVAALRRQPSRGNVVITLLATAWFVTLGCWVLRETQPAGPDWLGIFTSVVGVVAAAVALHFGPAVSALARGPTCAMDRLAVALWAQAGILLVVAVALQFDGYGQSIGWMAISLAAIEIGRRLRLRAVDVFGLVVGALALARVAVFDSGLVFGLGTLGGTVFAAGNVTVTGWSILALVAILATHTAARRLGTAWRQGPVVLAALGTLGWLVLCEMVATGLATTAGWLLGGSVLIAMERLGRRQGYLEIGLVALTVATSAWLYDAAVLRSAGAAGVTGHLPVLNWQMALVAAIVVVGWWSSRVLARRRQLSATGGADSGSAAWQVALIVGAVLLLVGFSFELDRIVEILRAGGRPASLSFDLLRQLFFTMVWAAGSVGIGLVARAAFVGRTGSHAAARGPDLLVRFAWVMLGACAVKWLIGDTLYWTVLRRADLAQGAWPVANVQLVTGLVVAASGLALHGLSRRTPAAATRGTPPDALPVGPGTWVAPAAVMLLLWGLSFEVDRAIAHYEATRPDGWMPVWHPLHLRELWCTLLWAAGGLAMIAWTRIRRSRSMLAAGWYVLAAAALFWLSFDTVGWRLLDDVSSSRIVFNTQFLVGAATGLMVAAAIAWIRRTPVPVTGAVGLGFTLIGLICLCLGTLEIDRFFDPETGRLGQNTAMARQTGLSVYWGVFAITVVALGFAKRSAGCRYAGLALLAITLVKVFTIDLAEVRDVYRVLSFLVVGLLLVATSVVYARLAPRLAVEEPTAGKQG